MKNSRRLLEFPSALVANTKKQHHRRERGERREEKYISLYFLCELCVLCGSYLEVRVNLFTALNLTSAVISLEP